MSANLKPFIARLAAGETLSDDQAEAAFDVIIGGEATPAQIGALLMAMRVRGETVAEITGAVRAMRARMTAIEAPADARVISRAIVSNTLAYPKKLPIVLIATLATLMLCAGCIATGELLRMTAPRASAAFAAAPARAAEPVIA